MFNYMTAHTLSKTVYMHVHDYFGFYGLYKENHVFCQSPVQRSVENTVKNIYGTNSYFLNILFKKYNLGLREHRYTVIQGGLIHKK